MSDASIPKRKWHFSTILVLFLVGFVLIKLNNACRISFHSTFGEKYAFGLVECGWPLTCSSRPGCIFKEEFYNDAVASAALTKSITDEDWICHVNGVGYAVPIIPGKDHIELSDILTPLIAFTLDVLIAIAILWGIGLACEWLIRRREAKRHD